MKGKSKEVSYILLGMILLVFLTGCTSKAELQQKDTQINELKAELSSLKRSNEASDNFYISYMDGLEHYYSAQNTGLAAQYNYDSFSYNWGNGFLEASIKTCQEARAQYAQSNTEYHNAITAFEAAKEIKDLDVLAYYINASNLAIDIQWYEYESCEYFESSARCYLKEDYSCGDLELEKANKDIKLRDGLIKQYNSYLSKIEFYRDK